MLNEVKYILLWGIEWIACTLIFYMKGEKEVKHIIKDVLMNYFTEIRSLVIEEELHINSWRIEVYTMNSNTILLIGYSHKRNQKVYFSIRNIVNRLKKSKLRYSNTNSYTL